MTKIPKILIIYTGGTIGMVKESKDGALRSFDFSGIKKNIPELNLLDCHIESVSFSEPIDSSNMNTQSWIQIVDLIEKYYSEVDGFVVLTGTDTMSYTSSAVSFMLENLAKPVIFTGSQLPIGDFRTDAKENLITSIQIASTRENNSPKIQEVGLYFEYKLYRANRTKKISADQFDAFQSPNFPALCESGVNLSFNHSALLRANKNVPMVVRKNLDENVVILKLFPGITEEVIKNTLQIPQLRGVILETYGAGNAPTNDWFIDLLKKTIQKGIPIINVTQCISGTVVMGFYETSKKLREIGVVNGRDITTESAIAKLKYLLGQNLSLEEFKHYFELSLRGEMSI
ncbi:asparaginase [Namhaeicola litoreus]|uniref:Asparaginase n=1 Tax=Namhaeicola litoreus TaxID=1052145 RepID=A0ABW3XXN7_9FLAO